MSDKSFGAFVPGFDFLQGLVKNAGAAMPGFSQWVAPTLNPQELDKRIQELRAVQFWLEQNARMLATTVQALEVQKMTLSTLHAMNVPMKDLQQALKMPPMPDLGAAMGAMRSAAEAAGARWNAATGMGGADTSGGGSAAAGNTGSPSSAGAGSESASARPGTPPKTASGWPGMPAFTPSASRSGAQAPAEGPAAAGRRAATGLGSDDDDPAMGDDDPEVDHDDDEDQDAPDHNAADETRDDDIASRAEAASGEGAGAGAAADAAAAGAKAAPLGVDPMQWWNALTQQFTQIASQAMKDTQLMKQGMDAAGESLRKAATMPADMMNQAAKVAQAATDATLDVARAAGAAALAIGGGLSDF